MPRPRQPGIRADFPGTCPRCGRRYVKGERIVPRDGTYIHVTCASGQDDE